MIRKIDLKRAVFGGLIAFAAGSTALAQGQAGAGASAMAPSVAPAPKPSTSPGGPISAAPRGGAADPGASHLSGSGPSSTSSTSLGASTGPSSGPIGSATGGSGGSAAAGGASASTLGVGGTSTSPTQSSSALGVEGSAASTGGHTMTHSGVHGNRNLNGQAMAQAHEGGTFSKSHTHCRTGPNVGVGCRTKSMAHTPGSKPVMSTTTTNAAPQ